MFPAYERRVQPRDPSFLAPSLADQQESRHGVPLTLQPQRSGIREQEPTGGPGRALGHQRLARFGGLFQACRNVDGVPRDHALAGPRFGHGDHLTRVHPDPYLQSDPVAAR
jgi:hypothetical protein